MAESLGEKTEDATPKKLETAREQGQVAKSQDLSGGVTLVVAVLVLLFYGGAIMERFAIAIRTVLQHEIAGSPFFANDATDSFVSAMTSVVLIVAPVMVVAFLASYISNFVQIGWLFTLKPIQPNFGKLNPQKGVKRLVETKNFVKTLVNVIKLAGAIGLTSLLMSFRLERLAALPTLPLGAAAWMVGVTIFEVAILLAVLLFILGFIDWIYQRWQYKKDQRMTKQEVKDELKQTEGDPQIKQRMQEIRRNQKRKASLQAVPDATVLIMNPTHYAVALRYVPTESDAPVCIAKGRNLIALKMREIAEEHNVPVVENPPLARALHAGLEEDQPIPPQFFQAVAEVINYVYRTGQRAMTL